jgi:hypothetical protein
MPYCYKPKIADIPKFGTLGQMFYGEFKANIIERQALLDFLQFVLKFANKFHCDKFKP